LNIHGTISIINKKKINELKDEIKNMMDTKNIKRLLQVIQNLARRTFIFELVFYTGKMRADFLLCLGSDEFHIAFKIYN
jgi:hypothetical protein